jgi:nucleotide-binding universal stress UspA family protein
MHKVLLPVDGSGQSKRAVDFFLNHTARAGPVEAVLLHVHPASRVFALHEHAVLSDLRRSAEKAVAEPRQRLDAARIPCKQRLELGDIAQTIVDVAREEGCAHIVMGTSGQATITGLLLGSVATSVLQSTDIPVTLVK